MMLQRIVLTVIAYAIIGVVSVLIARQCWKDSKEDFKDVFRCAWRAIKKKKAD